MAAAAAADAHALHALVPASRRRTAPATDVSRRGRGDADGRLDATWRPTPSAGSTTPARCARTAWWRSVRATTVRAGLPPRRRAPRLAGPRGGPCAGRLDRGPWPADARRDRQGPAGAARRLRRRAARDQRRAVRGRRLQPDPLVHGHAPRPGGARSRPSRSRGAALVPWTRELDERSGSRTTRRSPTTGAPSRTTPETWTRRRPARRAAVELRGARRAPGRGWPATCSPGGTSRTGRCWATRAGTPSCSASGRAWRGGGLAPRCSSRRWPPTAPTACSTRRSTWTPTTRRGAHGLYERLGYEATYGAVLYSVEI